MNDFLLFAFGEADDIFFAIEDLELNVTKESAFDENLSGSFEVFIAGKSGGFIDFNFFLGLEGIGDGLFEEGFAFVSFGAEV